MNRGRSGARVLAEDTHDVPHSRPLLGPAEEQAALRVLRSGRLAPGAEAEGAAELLARLSGCRSAVMLSSGTTAISLALAALRIGPGEPVAIPSYACAAVLYGVRAAGAVPLVCDIDPETLALDPQDVVRRGGGETRAAIVVHPFGRPVRLDRFRAHGLAVVEDCAQALGARDGGAPVGSRGDAAIFSFAPTKMATCGGPGGGLASPSGAIVEAVRDLAGHDQKEDTRQRFNGLMGDLHAAVAAVQLGRLAEFGARRRSIARRYDEAFAPLGLTLAPPLPDAEPVVYRYLLRVPDAGAVLAALGKRGIAARRPVFRPLHHFLGAEEGCPHADHAHRTIVSLPIYPALTDDEVDRVIAEARSCLS